MRTRSPSQSDKNTFREKTSPFLSSLPTLCTNAEFLIESSDLDYIVRVRKGLNL